MCLLVTQSADSPRLSADWLEDFYDSNSDGVGVMYAFDGRLVVEKLLPNDGTEFVQFYNEHIHGKECAFHLRMKTHGHIDLINCHPYEILNYEEHGIDLWLMHNGILHTDNKADITKSDTWHYINDYLRPMLIDNPDFAFHPAFISLIADHIGNGNKFVIMDSFGRQAVLNEGQGVYWGGRWLSNTYAWSAPTATSKSVEQDRYDMALADEQIKTPPVKYSYTSSHYSRYNSFGYPHMDDLGYDGEYYTTTYGKGATIVDEDFDIDDTLVELELAGFKRAGRMSRRQAGEFVDKFGVDSFFEISYMVLDKSIDEDWYIRIMSDFASARECFPWLEDVEKKRKYIN